ncbi:hypothetical protein [Veronia pacifica]|uniref:Uncharacterized protein n=1 Tax=Veronia pacifica TaxID=1080227 RepID=A0A1C3EAH5_9GAMM|nr:hypothetical protein [Veronia pacifica]ODA30242.1 hypothetical protein A8L45_20795 [Veronia pacifica]
METIRFKEFGILVDSERTREFYKHQNNILEDCSCSDCDYFYNTFSKLPFSVYKFLSLSGVDLQKNLASEPTGVQCAVENNNLIFCDQDCLFFGKLPKEELEFTYIESNLNFKVYFYHISDYEIKVQINLSTN